MHRGRDEQVFVRFDTNIQTGNPNKNLLRDKEQRARYTHRGYRILFETKRAAHIDYTED
jgi:hypothetical protein